MAGKNHLRQIKAQAAAAGTAVPGIFFAVKSLENVREGFLADVGSGIFHGQDRAAVKSAAPYPDFGALGGVKGGIGKKVFHGPAQERGVAVNDDAGYQVRNERLFPLFGKRSKLGQLLFDEGS